MGLRPHREVMATTNQFVGNAAMERGGVVSVASGQIGSYATEASGAIPIGVLLNDIEDINYFKERENLNLSRHDIGSVLAIVTRGEVETDFLDPAATGTINAGDIAYLSSSGWITNIRQPSDVDVNVTVSPRVGVFTTGDHDVRGVGLGWARVRIDISPAASVVTR